MANSWRNWPKRLWNWLRVPRLFLGDLLAGIVAAYLTFGFAGSLTAQTARAGTLLEIMGLVVVARGIVEVRSALGRPTPWQALLTWWAQRPRFGPRPVVLKGAAASVGGAAGTLSAVLSPHLDANEDVETRLERLETSVELLRKADQEIRGIIKAGRREAQNLVNAERKERMKADRETSERLEKATVGVRGGRWEALGLAWVACGLIAANHSAGVASALEALLALPPWVG